MTDAAYWDRIAPKYSKRPISDPDAYEATLARVAAHLSPTDRALELGCGTGSTALRLAPLVASYTGSDLSPGMIAIARDKKWDAAQDNLTFRTESALAEKTEPDAFDVILAFNLLHLVDTEAALARMHALLPAGGRLITKTPCVGAKWYYRPLVAALQLVGKAPPVRFLKVEEYDEMIRRAGFEIAETGLYPPSTPSRFVVAHKK